MTASIAADCPVPGLAIVIPLRDEASGLPRLLAELEAGLATVGRFEVVCVDDGSVDGTADAVVALMADRPWLRLVRHAVPCGKSAALWTGVHAARAATVATMNGDGRNDPAAIPRMVAELAEAGAGCGLVVAQRIGRHDPALRRLRSKIGSLLRDAILGDGVRDATCGLKCFPRHVFVDLPYFDGLHRFLPTLVRRDGYAISLIDVVDRPSWNGRPPSGLFKGIWHNLADILGVWWVAHRRGHIPVLPADAGAAASPDAERASHTGADPLS